MNKWQAEITPERWGYSIKVSCGLLEISSRPWRSTRRGAERCARRLLAREDAREQRESERWTIK